MEKENLKKAVKFNESFNGTQSDLDFDTINVTLNKSSELTVKQSVEKSLTNLEKEKDFNEALKKIIASLSTK